MTLLTLAETAERLHVSLETLRKLYRREGLPVIRVSANRFLVSEEGLQEWLAGRTIASWSAESGAAAASTEPPTDGESPTWLDETAGPPTAYRNQLSGHDPFGVTPLADQYTAELEATRCEICQVRLGHDVHCPLCTTRRHPVRWMYSP